MSQCLICCETFTAHNRAKIICNNVDCGYSACKQCIRQYLLTTTSDPHCMMCKKAWDNRFVIEHLNKNWYNKEYRIHRKQLLLDRQLAMLPDTMEAASREQDIRGLKNEIAQYDQEQKVLKQKIRDIGDERIKVLLKINAISRGQGEKRKFIMACPGQDCRGFLSTSYKCGVCEKYSCPKCVEFIGEHKDIQFHQCDPDQLKTAELIREQTKPCPGCGERISKVEGCDQMWCTICKVAFSWRTGQRDTGRIHNPHFFEAQQQLGLEVRNPGDQVCGGLPYWWGMETKLVKLINLYDKTLLEKYSECDSQFKEQLEHLRKQYNITGTRSSARYSLLHRFLINIYRKLVEFERLCLAPTRTQLQTHTDTTELRVKYILNEITQEKMATTLLRTDKLRKKYTDILHVYETIMAVGIDTFRHLEQVCIKCDKEPLIEDDLDDLVERFKVLEEIRKYSNRELQKISELYSHQVIQFYRSWGTSRQKFTTNDLRNAKLKEDASNGQGAFAS